MNQIIQILVFIIVITTNLNGQYKSTKEIVRTLSSETFSGRSVSNQGDLKAAVYIRNYFKINKIKPLDPLSYFQHFYIDVNVFSAPQSFSINEVKYKLSEDYIIAANSPSIHVEGQILCIKESEILRPDTLEKKIKHFSYSVLYIKKDNQLKLNSKEKKIIQDFILSQQTDFTNFSLIVIEKEKLTASIASYTSKTPIIYVKHRINATTGHKIRAEINQKLISNHKTQNVAGWIPGKNKNAKTFVFCAHYDHLGKMGPKTYFPGANDNASGIAILLNLASYFSIEENRPNNNLVFIAFGAEEIGLLGSKHFINNPLIPLNKINWLYNLDIAGTGSEGLKVVHNKNAVKLLKTLININNDKKLLKNIFERDMACNSDHCYFDALGIPVLYGYTLGGSKAYHDTQDIADNLEYENMKKYRDLLQDFVKKLDKI